MTDLKKMYTTLSEDPFPATLKIVLGDEEVVFRKRTWTIDHAEKGLRYGENPDQPAALYEPVQGHFEVGGVRFRGLGQGLVSALSEEHMLQAGKHPGKTNLTDVDNGLNILQYLAAEPAAVILKHNNPCGAAWTEAGAATALDRAYKADRIAAFGGAIVLNRPVDRDTAELVNQAYYEVLAAPDYEPGTLDILTKKKNLRILRIPGIGQLDELVGRPFLDVKSLMDGGLVLQFSFSNRIRTPEDFLAATATTKEGATLTARGPDKREADDLLFAWAVEAGVTSNSVLLARDGVTTAIGTGEQDRVGCVQLAVTKAYTKHADLLASRETGRSLFELKLEARDDVETAELVQDIEERTRHARAGLPGSVAVSDGFFPFRDGVDLLVAEGVTAIAQPGGSVRDHEVIAAVNEASPQVAMVFTGQRSFKH